MTHPDIISPFLIKWRRFIFNVIGELTIFEVTRLYFCTHAEVVVLYQPTFAALTGFGSVYLWLSSVRDEQKQMCRDTHEPLRGSQTFAKWKNNRCLLISCPVNLNDVFGLCSPTSADAALAVTPASLQIPCSRRVLPPCPSPPNVTPEGTFVSKRAPSPNTPFALDSPGPSSSASQQPLKLYKVLLLRTRACFYAVHCSRFGPLRVRRHLLSTLPAVAHSLLTAPNNSPMSRWHARRTQIRRVRAN